MDDTVRCKVWIGRDANRSIQDAIRATLTVQRPVLLWREPCNGRSRVPGFQGLMPPGDGAADESVKLIEARLFYETGMMHLLADEKCTRWACWCAGNAKASPARPAWCLFPGKESPEESLQVKSRTILLREKDTTGLGWATLGTNRVLAVEYFRGGTLRWWRLEIHVQRS